MSKKIKIIIYVVLMALFAIYMFAANNLMDWIFKAQNPDYLTFSPISFSSIPNITTPTVCVDGVTYQGGMTETLYYKGWGFCETLNDTAIKV